MRHETKSVEEMYALARKLVDQLIEARVVLLEGELASGKTTFTQGVAKALGVERPVRSPTFTLVNEHGVDHRDIDRIVHVDLYRLEHVDEQEARQLGLDEFLKDERSLVMIEWPDRLDPALISDALKIQFSVEGEVHSVDL